MRIEDVHGQVGVGISEFMNEFLVERVVDGFPERITALLYLCDVLRCGLPCCFCRERRGDFRWEGGTKCT